MCDSENVLCTAADRFLSETVRGSENSTVAWMAVILCACICVTNQHNLVLTKGQ